MTMSEFGASQGLRFDGTFAVTGGGSGIGAGICRLIAAGGGKVAVLDRNGETASAVAAEIGGTAHQVDVTDEATVAATYRSLGPIAGAVNCAGFSIMKPIVTSTLDDWRLMTSVHLDGTFLCLRAAAASMLEHDIAGAIVNIASINALHSHRGSAAYAAAKAGVVMLTRVAALELAAAGIRVNAVAPGFVVNGVNHWRMDDPQFVQTWAGDVPSGRVGQPADIAGAVGMLLHPAARWLTGQLLVADGGASIRVEPKVTADDRWTKTALVAQLQAPAP
jgi:3-oxoacyl-[acyl-carrier protein] reductase